MKKRISTTCPGCGAALFVTSLAIDQKGARKLHAEPSPWATFVRLETVEMLCANGCEVTVQRDSGEQTAKMLEEIGELPVITEVLGEKREAPEAGR